MNLLDESREAREDLERQIRDGTTEMRRNHASCMINAELEAGSRFATLLPFNVERGGLCEPGRVYSLTRNFLCGKNLVSEPMALCLGQRFLRLMTHPADARAGWHLIPPLGFSVVPIGMIDQEVRFDAFHWAFRTLKSGLENAKILEYVHFQATAVLRAPEPRPMIHGLWVKFYDGRCRSPSVEHYENIAREPIGKAARSGENYERYRY